MIFQQSYTKLPGVFCLELLLTKGDMNMELMNCYANRELSWLKFNQRVLEEAQDPENPLCERLSFLSIFQSNLDEFFMVRVGSIYDQMLVSKNIRENKTNMTCEEQLHAIFQEVRTLLRCKDKVYLNLQRELEKKNVTVVDFHSISEKEAAYLRLSWSRYCRRRSLAKNSRFRFCKTKPFMRLQCWKRRAMRSWELCLAAVKCSHGISCCPATKTDLFWSRS